MTAASPLTRQLLILLAFGNFVVGMGAFVVIGIIEPVSEGLDVSASAAGTLLTIYALAYAPLSPVLVALTGRIGRRRVLASGLGLFAVAAGAGAMAPSFEVLGATRVLAAAGAGVVTPVTAAIVAGLAPPENRAKALATVFLGITLAQVLGIPAGSWVAYTFGWRAALLIVAALAVPVIFLIWTRVPKGLSFQSTSLSDLGAVLRDGPMMVAIGFTASFLAAIFLLYTYLAPLLSARMGFGRDEITLVLLVFGVGAVIGNILGGALADRIGAGRTLTLLVVLQIPLLPFYSLLPVPGIALLAWTLVWSTVGWSFGAAQQLRLVELCGAQAPVALALNASAIYVGSAVGSGIGAGVISLAGLDALGIAAAFMMIAALANLRLSRRLSPGGPAQPSSSPTSSQ
ncbi:MAG: MFS transporter [Pseudomonadota bacterium]